MIRTTTDHATVYTAAWDQTTTGDDIYAAVIAAGLPVPTTWDGPGTHVGVQQTGDGWRISVSIPGDDGGSWSDAVQAVLEPA